MTTRKTTSKTESKAAQSKAQENPAATTAPNADDSAQAPEAGQGEAAVQQTSAQEPGAASQGGDAKGAAKDAAPSGEIPALFVRTRKRFGSRRRAGFRFTREGMGVALESLTSEQVAALKKDPALEVEECTVPAEPDEGEE